MTPHAGEILASWMLSGGKWRQRGWEQCTCFGMYQKGCAGSLSLSSGFPSFIGASSVSPKFILRSQEGVKQGQLSQKWHPHKRFSRDFKAFGQALGQVKSPLSNTNCSSSLSTEGSGILRPLPAVFVHLLLLLG